MTVRQGRTVHPPEVFARIAVFEERYGTDDPVAAFTVDGEFCESDDFLEWSGLCGVKELIERRREATP